MMNLNSVLKSRYIVLLTKVYIVKAMVFPVVMYASESEKVGLKLNIQKTKIMKFSYKWKYFTEKLKY